MYSLEIFRELGARWDVARTLANLGRSLFALGDDSEAGRFWCESLRVSIDAQAALVGLEAITGLARLKAKRGDRSGALELLLVVLEQPACAEETRERARLLRAELVNQLTAQEIEAVQREAGEKTLASITGDILREDNLRLPPG